LDRTKLLAELRRLFDNVDRSQWAIGDLLIREVGPPPLHGVKDGSHEEVAGIARDLGRPLGTLLEYRLMAAKFQESRRLDSVSFSAHQAAAYTKDPQKVLAEATKLAERTARQQSKETGRTVEPRVTTALVRTIAAKPEHQPPMPISDRANARQARVAQRNGIDLFKAAQAAAESLRQLMFMLEGTEVDEWPEKVLDGLGEAMDRCDERIGWIRTFLSGEGDIVAGAEALLKG